jgi:GMP synthase (glutamine-hydrolysing)
MKQEILIVKNITHEGPGLLENVLIEHGINIVSVDLSAGALFPNPRNYKALVVLGGPQSANDETPSMQLQLRQIETALHENIPYLGICLGMQTLVKAGGGNVVPCQRKEIGFSDIDGHRYRIELTQAGKEDPLFAGLEYSFPVFQLHGETVELFSTGMELLAKGKSCINQAVKVGENAYGLQCHFEMTPIMFSEWSGIDTDLKQKNPSALMEEFEAIKKEYTTTGLRLMNNFLRIADLA